ncbi:MAG: site-specific integrase [Bacteroidota bacterium]
MPGNWETSDQKAKITKRFPENSQVNTRLADIEKAAQKAFDQYVLDHNQQPSKPAYLNLLEKSFSKDQPVKLDLFGFIEQYTKEVEVLTNTKTGRIMAPATIKGYKNTLSHLKAYAQAKKTKLDFETIDLNFYHDFVEYLTLTKKFAINTIGKQIKNLKTFLGEATERGLNKNIAFTGKRFKGMAEDTENIYLTDKEILDIYELDLSENTKLERVRDLFVVGCHTGLRFSDFSRLTAENIKGDMIEIETQKTAEKVIIPITPTVAEIMAKYKDQYPNSLPPAISNQKTNEYLKEICKDENICKDEKVKSLHSKVSITSTKGGKNITVTYKKWELVGTHAARRSFATNLYLSGLDTMVIRAITGHKTEKAFMKYIKITPSDKAKILQLHQQAQFKLKVV